MWQTLNTGKKNDRTLILKMLSLLESFIFQTIDNDSFCSSLVHFLMMLRIDKQMGQLQTANNYLFMLIRVMYCVQMLEVEILLLFNQQKQQEKMKQEYFLQ